MGKPIIICILFVPIAFIEDEDTSQKANSYLNFVKFELVWNYNRVPFYGSFKTVLKCLVVGTHPQLQIFPGNFFHVVIH